MPHAVGSRLPFQPAQPPIRRFRSPEGLPKDTGHEKGLGGVENHSPNSNSPLGTKLLNFYKSTLDKSRDFTKPYVCWFCSVNNGENEIVGSGLFFTVCEKYFCLTAKHVIENRNKHDDFCITTGEEAKLLIGIPKLIKKIYLSNNLLDIAFFEIPNALKTFISNRHFLEINRFEDILDKGDTPRTLIMTGYPHYRSISGSKTKKTIGVFTAFGTSSINKKPKSRFKQFSKKTHISLMFSPEGNTYSGTDVAEPVMPEGFSGGPIWNIKAFESKTNLWTTDKIKLCGITTTYYKQEKLVAGTSINEVVKFVLKKRPDLKDELKI